MNNVRELLDFDPLAHAEEVTGQSYKDDEATMGLGMLSVFSHNDRKKETLESLGDSVYGTKIDVYLRIVEDLGFKKVFERKIRHKHSDNDDTQFIYFHPAHGLLLEFDSYWGESVNGSEMYFNWKPHGDNWPHQCSGGFNEGRVFIGKVDAREAIRFKIHEFLEEGQFVTPWVEQPSIYLLTSADWEALPGYDQWDQRSKGIDDFNQAVFDQLPSEVRAAVLAG